MSWVKKLGDDIEHFRPQDGEIEPVSIMELDEMWYLIQKKRIITQPIEKPSQNTCTLKPKLKQQQSKGLTAEYAYLARFRRKAFCYSKAVHMVQATLTIFFTPNWKQYIC